MVPLCDRTQSISYAAGTFLGQIQLLQRRSSECLRERWHTRTSSLRDRMQNGEMDRTYALPDGRVVIARIIDPSDGDTPELGPTWELEIQGFDGAVIVGHPVQSALAEALGYNVAQEEWPRWIGDVALQIEADAA